MIYNPLWPSRLNFALGKSFGLTTYFLVNFINPLPTKKLIHNSVKNLPRWLGSLSLPWSLWAGKRHRCGKFNFDLLTWKMVFWPRLIRIQLNSAEWKQNAERIFWARGTQQQVKIFSQAKLYATHCTLQVSYVSALTLSLSAYVRTAVHCST